MNKTTYEENERRSRALNTSKTFTPTPRNEHHYCPECGEHKAEHTLIASSATEPPEMQCPGGVDRHVDLDSDEPTHNEFGELGFWVANHNIEF